MIPDPFAKMVTIPIRIRDGMVSAFGVKPLPALEDGAVGDLVLPEDAIKDQECVRAYNYEETVEWLPAETVILFGISVEQTPADKHEKLISGSQCRIAGDYALFAEVRLLQPLRLRLRGTKHAQMTGCTCHIPILKKEARSLNHAFTLISTAFETKRMAHTGNVFQRGFVKLDGRWVNLDILRLRRQLEWVASMEDGSIRDHISAPPDGPDQVRPGEDSGAEECVEPTALELRSLREAWAPVAMYDGRTLFPMERDEFLRRAAVPVRRLQDWHASGYLSFDVTEMSEFEDANLAEVQVVRSVIDSGLETKAARRLLESLPKPYCYDPNLLGYNFNLGCWQMCPGRNLEAVKENVRDEVLGEMPAHLAAYIESLAEAGDVDELAEISQRVTRAIQEAARKAMQG